MTALPASTPQIIPAHILIVEDEPKLAGVLADYLRIDGYVTSIIADGREVIPFVRAHAPSLILLDLMLPGRPGMDICRELRQFSGIPVIILTARVDEIDRLLGLELGADDYVCKPFSPREVVARVKAILRRAGGTNPAPGTSAPLPSAAPASDAPRRTGLRIDEAQHTALLDGIELKLTPVEFRLLTLLSSGENRIFQREYLLHNLYQDHRVVTDRTIDSHVKNLRRKLQALRPGTDPIVPIYGIGYRLDIES